MPGFARIKSLKKLDGDVQRLWDISCYPIPSFFANGIGVHNCQYCESPLSGSFTVRAMNPQRIQDEIRDIRDTFGIRGVTFFDDEMNLYRDRMLKICEKLKELGDIVWRGFMVTGVSKWDEELARACKESGCYEVASGIESFHPQVLKNIKKPATPEMNMRFIRIAKKAGLRVKAFLIIGNAGESWETIRETDRRLAELKAEGCAPDDIDASILQVYPGAPYYKNPQDIVFRKDWEKSYYKSAPGQYESLVQVRTAAMSAKDLIAARNYIEDRYKPEGWIKQHGDRLDLDRVYESIEHAKKKLA